MSVASAPTGGLQLSVLQQAMLQHQGGELHAAEQLYLQVPDSDPQHADALHLLGVLCAQRRQLERSHALIWQAITLNPGEAMFHNNLANVCMERGLLAEAEPLYVRAIELDGARLDALSNLGLLLSRTGRQADAEKLLKRAVELSPETPDFRQNLANLYLGMGRQADALQQCHDGLVIAPRSRVLRSLLALAYSHLGQHDKARAVLQAWAHNDPDDPYPRHHLAASTGVAVPERASDAYVSRLFDGFAGSFDAKLADLSYQAPQQVAGELARLVGTPARQLALLDAGCGTGLCGPLLAPYASTLVGVDLSEGMLRIAHQRGGYDSLIQGELVAFLASRPLGFDAVLSADTLCYFGVLTGFAAAAFAALQPGGLLVFTVEALHGAGVAAEVVAEVAANPADHVRGHRLQAHGRYSHDRDHVSALLQGAGFAAVLTQPVVLREEGGVPVEGWLVSCQRPAHGDTSTPIDTSTPADH